MIHPPEALDLAKDLIKHWLRSNGIKISNVSSTEITKRAVEYLSTPGGSLTSQYANLIIEMKQHHHSVMSRMEINK